MDHRSNKGKVSIATKILILSIVITIGTPLTAFADAGVPMIFLTFPAMLIALFPVILVETIVIQKAFKMSFKKALIPSGAANVVSTLAGFPLAWGILLGLELLATGGSCGPGFKTLPNSILTVLLESAWLCPWEDHLYWLIPVAFINCLIVAFFISIFIEFSIIKKKLLKIKMKCL